MPYRIEKQGDKFCVFKEGDDTPIACHDTRQQAEAQRRALYASEGGKASTQVKRLDENTIGGYGAVYGGPAEKDLEGDYFTSDTNFWLDRYQNQPVIFDHTLSEDVDPKELELSTVKMWEPDDVGLWVEAQIERHNRWADAVMELVDRGVLHFSTGAAAHLVRRGEDGQLKSWPIIEISLTPEPAEPRNTQVLRLKHTVNHQEHDPTPEAQAQQAARHDGASPVESSITKENKAMTLALNETTVKALVFAYADSNIDVINDALKGVEHKNLIADALQPLASELASMAGADEAQTLAYLIDWVSSHATEEDAAPAPEPMPTEEPMLNATLSADMQALQDQLNEMKALMSDLLPDKPAAAKRINLNFNRPESKPKTLGRWIKAIVDKDYSILKPEHAQIKAAYKAMGINPDTAGGYLVPTEQSNQLIELLRSGTKVLPLCMEMPMNSDTLTIPKLTGGATAYWIGENASITESAQTYGQIILRVKKLAAFVPLSNELLSDSDPAVDAIIRQDIAQALGEKLDNAILLGSGLANEPLGVINQGVTTTALNAAPTFANIVDCITRVESENVREDPPWAWVTNPRDRGVLAQIVQTTSGEYLWTEMGMQGHAMVGGYPSTLRGYPVVTTTQLDVDADNNNETEIFFGQWKDVVVGVRKTIEIMASSEAGNAFQYDQTYIRAVARYDVGVRHDESIEVLTDVRTS